eukprot:m.700606 g.700606  ORF g.700606 m.700606 type:complete len:94 (+) comp58707_c0_seq2:133-414(+)
MAFFNSAGNKLARRFKLDSKVVFGNGYHKEHTVPVIAPLVFDSTRGCWSDDHGLADGHGLGQQVPLIHPRFPSVWNSIVIFLLEFQEIWLLRR